MQEIDDTIKLPASSLSHSASIPSNYDVEWGQLGLDQNEREAREASNAGGSIEETKLRD